MNPTGIILLEGADASGKTTLARHLCARFNGRNLHSHIHKDIWRWHCGALRRAIRESTSRVAVMDRLWQSEQVYGPIFRGAPGYNVGARCLDRILRRYAALTVLCAPSDQRRQERRWSEGRAAGKHEHFDSVRTVIQRYADLRDGNVAHPGDTYVDQLIRFGDYVDRDDVMIYDLDRNGGDLDRFADHALDRLMTLRDRALDLDPDRWNLTGRGDDGRQGWLLVGDEPSPESGRRSARVPTYPFTGSANRLDSSAWLNTALHHLAVREDRIVITNANDPDDHLDGLLMIASGSPATRVIALGDRADRRLRERGWTDHELVPHPQYHRRFRHKDGVAGYAELLREAMRT